MNRTPGSRVEARASGRTFRIILRSLEAVSRGENVTLVAYSSQYAYHLFNNAMDMCKSYLQGGINYNPQDKAITFPNGKTLRFRSSRAVTQNPDGLGTIVYDHYRGESH